jgi:hypothetical protein
MKELKLPGVFLGWLKKLLIIRVLEFIIVVILFIIS